ncbi:MAG: hypothetical protein CMD31_09350 [Flavobacteriales bacterium]|jgi:uncharacterized protein DUF3127|nr:DUF3127 domain-containing protein [Flavobacteriales bacterium]MBQ20948.1 hypothetical protein [Flavobacteriales bacterium]|tara:strand:+ start:17825 stop:18196 length:372 start_codon:yes stop_codon:yes gene_type:complete
MALSIKGKLAQILNLESGTSKAGKEWKKQSFVIDTGDQYNPHVCFSLFGEDKLSMLSNFNIGQEIEVSFNLSSREFNGKWYHNLDAWRINAAENAAPQNGSPVAVATPSIEDMPSDENDDLPF